MCARALYIYCPTIVAVGIYYTRMTPPPPPLFFFLAGEGCTRRRGLGVRGTGQTRQALGPRNCNGHQSGSGSCFVDLRRASATRSAVRRRGPCGAGCCRTKKPCFRPLPTSGRNRSTAQAAEVSRSCSNDEWFSEQQASVHVCRCSRDTDRVRCCCLWLLVVYFEGNYGAHQVLQRSTTLTASLLSCARYKEIFPPCLARPVMRMAVAPRLSSP